MVEGPTAVRGIPLNVRLQTLFASSGVPLTRVQCLRKKAALAISIYSACGPLLHGIAASSSTAVVDGSWTGVEG